MEHILLWVYSPHFSTAIFLWRVCQTKGTIQICVMKDVRLWYSHDAVPVSHLVGVSSSPFKVTSFSSTSTLFEQIFDRLVVWVHEIPLHKQNGGGWAIGGVLWWVQIRSEKSSSQSWNAQKSCLSYILSLWDVEWCHAKVQDIRHVRNLIVWKSVSDCTKISDYPKLISEAL